MQCTKIRMKKLLVMVAAIFVVLTVVGQSVQAAGKLDEIKKAGVITVATETAYEPFEFKKGGKVVGLGRDILDELSKNLGVKVNQLELPWQGMLPGLIAKKYDMVATTLTITNERAAKYAFTAPIASYRTVLLKRGNDESLNSLSDLNGKTVGAEQGSLLAKQLDDINAKLQSDGGSGFKEIMKFKNNTDMWVSIANKTIDAGTYLSTAMPVLEKKRPGVFKPFAEWGEYAYIGWVTHPDDKDVRDAVSAEIIKMNKSGKLGEFQEKWFGFKMEVPTANYIPEGGH